MRKILFILLIISLVIFLQFLLVKNLWSYYLSALSNDKTKKIFVVQKGERVNSIAERLEKEGFIRSNLAFKIYLKLNGKEKFLQSGDFKLSSSMSVPEISSELSHGVIDKWVTFVEGLRNEEMAQILQKELSILPEEFLVRSEQGYMFPDTYLLPKDADALRVVKILKDNFSKKFTPEFEGVPSKNGLTKDDLVVLASIVEREARDEEQRKIIAGILIKRLKAEIPLEADATVQYALGYQDNEKTWWKKKLDEKDLKLDSPYNTRKHKGLPPKPICNPGLSSIKAVLNPKETPYWYYAHDQKGNIYYAKTLDEHNQNVAKYAQ